jgi:hypothetical protein
MIFGVRELNLKFMQISMILYQMYTNSFMVMISFVFGSWIINEFHNDKYKSTGRS